MSKKRTLAQAAIARFLNHCESNGWSIVALLYIYNLNNSLENRKTEEEFKNMLNEGDMSLEDFIVLFHAAMGVVED